MRIGAKWPTQPRAVATGCVTWFAESLALYKPGKYADAAVGFAAYADCEPTDVWGSYMVGLSRWKDGENEESEAALRAITSSGGGSITSVNCPKRELPADMRLP